LLVDRLKQNILYANGLNDQQIEDFVRHFPAAAHFLHLDQSEFDTQQSLHTQFIEKCLVPKLFTFANSDGKNGLSLYYALREGMKSVSNVHDVQKGTEKSSGEPATLFLNTIVSFFLALCYLDDDFEFLMSKGDDIEVGYADCDEVKLVVDFQIRGDETSCFMPVKPKLHTTRYFDFCNMLFCNGTLFYNYGVLARKLLSRRYDQQRMQNFSSDGTSTYEQYQTAVADKLKPYRSHPDNIINGLAYALQLKPQYVEIAMQHIHAFVSTPWSEFRKHLYAEIVTM